MCVVTVAADVPSS